MSIFSTVDDFILDRIFQPIANKLDGWATPSEIGCSCLMGASVMALGQFWVAFTNSSEGMVGPIINVVGAWIVWGIYKYRSAIDSGTNFYREDTFYQFMRISWIAFTIFITSSLYAYVGTPQLMYKTFDAAVVILTGFGLCFLACRKPPPQRKTSHAPAWATRS